MRNAATTVRWQDGKFSVGGQKDYVKGKVLGLAKGPVLNGVKDMGKAELDDARAVVVNGAGGEGLHTGPDDQEVLVTSSDGETSSEADSSSGSEAEEEEEGDTHGHDRQVARLEDKDHDMADESAEEFAEPSFGDLVHAQTSQPIEVEATFAGGDAPNPMQALSLSKPQALTAPDSISLGTVISQALRTNDVTLLESCLHTTDLGTIRSTIERLDSKLATTLLSKLAERLHRRPGRAGSLMVWVQWTLVSHGGYLISQPNTMKQLGSLNKVISERVNALQPLLALKGKLDMLAAQSQLRRSMQNAAAAAAAQEEDEQEGVIYVEGQEEDDSSDEAAQKKVTRPKPYKHTPTDPATSANPPSSSESESGSDMPTTNPNGLTYPLSDSEPSTSSLIDDEASETDASSEEEDVNDEEVDHNSDDDEEEPETGAGAGNEDSEDAAQMPPRKRHAGMRRSAGFFGGRR
ncbi:MAG: Small subunit (SSU) processome component [Geoglossum umbratile]|nr:MAG: Small subunit (SSU) processome component [Geoglossum umbratile]